MTRARRRGDGRLGQHFTDELQGETGNDKVAVSQGWLLALFEQRGLMRRDQLSVQFTVCIRRGRALGCPNDKKLAEPFNERGPAALVSDARLLAAIRTHAEMRG